MTMLTPMVIEVNPPVLVPSIVSPPAIEEQVGLIISGTVTNVSELIFNNLSDEYIKYVLYFSGAKTITAASTDFVSTTSTDNGSTFANGANTYAYRVQRSVGVSGDTDHWTGTWNQMDLLSGVSNISGNFMAGSIDIYDPMDSGVRTTVLTHNGGMINVSGITSNFSVFEILGQREVAEANNAIRFFSASGNFSMNYALYGYKI